MTKFLSKKIAPWQSIRDLSTSKKKICVDSEFLVRRKEYNHRLQELRKSFSKEVHAEKAKLVAHDERKKTELAQMREARTTRRR